MLFSPGPYQSARPEAEPVIAMPDTAYPLAHKGDRLPVPTESDAMLVVPVAAPPQRQGPTLPDLFRAPVSTPGIFERAPASEAAAEPDGPSESELSDSGPSASAGPMSRFLTALADLKSGRRQKPVVVLHIGDSHVASDSFTRGIRSDLQAQFGDAGRGAVIPAGAFRYAAAAEVKTSESGPWSATTSMKTQSGPFGVSGIRMVSSSPAAKLTVAPTDGPFDWVEATVATGPGEGKVKLSVGGKSMVFDAGAPIVGAKTIRLEARGTSATVSPAGGGRTTVLWHAVGNDRPGVRYVNFGLIGATADVTKRWSDAIVKNDIAAIHPDLVVIGYGTNDGFNDNLTADQLRSRVTHLIELVRAVEPKAEFLLIGPADGMRRRGSGATCTAAGWSSAPKLRLVRDVYQAMAKEMHAGYWDWSRVMGGECGMNRWASSGLAAKDHVHLTPKGYARSADAFVDFLVSNPLYEERVALSN